MRGKREKFVFPGVLIALLALAAFLGLSNPNGEGPKIPTGPQNPPEAFPVYNLISFNINLPRGPHAEEPIEAIRRHVALMQKYGIRADYYFTWSALKRLLSADPEIVQVIQKAGMDIHHHGANRPPFPQLIDRIRGEEWEYDVAIVRQYETHDIDIRTGKLLDSPGGLLEMKRWLDPNLFSTGRFFQASILYVCKELGAKMAVGLKQNSGADRDDAWFMGVLNRPSNGGIGYQAIREGKVEEAIRYIEHRIEQRDRTKPFFLTHAIHDYDFFQERRKRLSAEEKEAVWSNYERFLTWLTHDSTLRTITMRDLYSMVIDDRERTIEKEKLIEIAKIVSETGSSLPDYIDLGEDFLSLSDAFQALASALQYYAAHQKLPERSSTSDILGPTKSSPKLSAPIEVEGERIVEAVQRITFKDRVPASVEVAGKKMNAAEFLVAMAKEYLFLAGDGKRKNVEIEPLELIPRSARSNSKADPLTQLQFWTFKPVRWRSL